MSETDWLFIAETRPMWTPVCIALFFSGLFQVLGLALLWWAFRHRLPGCMAVCIGLIALVSGWQLLALQWGLSARIVVDKVARNVTFKRFLSEKVMACEEIGDIFVEIRYGQGWWAWVVFRKVTGKKVFSQYVAWGNADYEHTVNGIRPFVDRIAGAIGKEAHYAPNTMGEGF